jgi:hypothetical protein
MFYVVQQNLFGEAEFRELIRVLDRQDLPHVVVKMIPFSGELDPEVAPPQPCLVFGSVGLTRLAVDRGWTPGAYLNDRFDFRIWAPAYGSHMLSHGWIETTMGHAAEAAAWDPFFLRPCLDDKSFTGEVIDKAAARAWASRLAGLASPSLTSGTPVIVAEPRQIFSEFRFFVIDRRVVTGTMYKLHGRSHRGLGVVDTDLIDFAQSRVDQWTPAECFVIDIATTPEGPKVIELGCINGAGFYGADLSKLLQRFEEMSAGRQLP